MAGAAERRRQPYAPWVLQGPKEPPPEAPRLRLFCIPQAGMGAWAFHGWQDALAGGCPGVEVMPVELPGRNSRLGEPAERCMPRLVARLADALAPEVRRAPYVLLGHSMGGWVAFELARELRRRGEPEPAHVYVSAVRAPHLCGKEHDLDPVRLSEQPFEGFWRHFFRRYGPNPDLEHPAVQKRLFPLLHADFALLEGYVYSPSPDEASDRFPLTAWGATEDNRYTPEQLGAWRRQSNIGGGGGGEGGAFRPRYFRGPHRYVVDSPGEAQAFLAADLARLLEALPEPHRG